MQPTVVITVVVESFGGAPPALVFPHRRRMPGREVLQQRPRTAVQPASFEGTVQVLAMDAKRGTDANVIDLSISP